MTNEILSNAFNININKEVEQPPLVTKEIISNNFTINVKKDIQDDIFENIQLITDENIKAGEYVRVAIKLKAKSTLKTATINPKLKLPQGAIIKNVQWETGTILTDYRPSVTEISQKSTELKVDLDGIKGTVSKIENDYVTESELNFSSQNLELKFSESGGYNLLYNGDFKRESQKWSMSNEGSIKFNQGELSCPNGRGVQLDGTLGKTTMLAQYNVPIGGATTPLTVSYYTYVSSAGVDGTTNEYRRGELTLNYMDGTNSWHGLSNVSKFDTWEKKTLTIKPTKKIQSISMSLFNRDTTRNVYYSAIMVETGEIAHDWTPNPNETYDGITTIDKDGITVSSSNSNTYTVMDNGSFRVENSNNGTIAELSNESRIPILNSSVITSEEIYANNLVYSQDATTIYVDLSSGKDTNTGTSSSKLKTIQEALDRLGRILGNNGVDSNVNIEISGSGSQSVSVRGFNGAGMINFKFANGTKLYCSAFDIRECGCRIKLSGNDTWSTSAGQIINGDTGSCVYVRNCTYVEIYQICIVGTGIGNGYGVNSVYGSNVYINSCEISKFNSPIRSEFNGTISMWNTKGSDLNYIYTGQHHGVCFLQKNTGTVPNATYESIGTGSSYYHLFGGGSGCTKTDGDIYKPSTTTPTPPSTTTNTKVWSFNKIWSDETLNNWSNRNELIQGYASTWNTGRWTGYMQMTDDFASIRSTISGATNLSGRIYVQRTSSSGNATGSKLCLYGSNGDPITTTTTINRSQGVWVTLTSAIVTKIQNGTIKYFYLRADTNSTSTYFKCESNAKIEITYTK